MLWWRVGSENTNAAENDRMNRNPLILRQTTEKERLHVLQVVDLSVLAAVSISYSDNAFSFLALRPPCIGWGTLVARLSLIGVSFIFSDLTQLDLLDSAVRVSLSYGESHWFKSNSR